MKKKLAYLSLIDIFPVNTGGKSVAYDFLLKYSKEYDVTLYFLEKSVFREKGFIPKKIPFKIIHIKKHSFLNKLPLIKKFHLELLSNTHELNMIKCDVVHLDFPYLYPIAKKIAKQNNANLILGAHNIEWKYYRMNKNIFWPILKIYENFVFRHVDKIKVISKSDYDYLSDFKNLKNKLEYVPSDVNKSIFNPYGKKHNYDKKYINLLFYGNLSTEQNIWALNYLKKKILSKLNEKYLLNVFGIGLRNESLVEDYKINYFGPIDNPAEYIRGCDAVIVPLNNGAGTKIRVLESVMCGKKVLVSLPVYEGLSKNFKKRVILCRNDKEFIKNLLNLKK